MKATHSTMIWGLVALVLAGWPGRVQSGEWTALVELPSQKLEGWPLDWSRDRVLLLARDGRLHDIRPSDVTNFRKVADSFRPYSQREIATQLAREFGTAFEVSSTGHYLVVHAAGQRDVWAGRFEELYRSFVQYFGTRGFRLEPPQFPLVAVVFPSLGQYSRHAESTGTSLTAGTVGYYAPLSNRIFLYDQGQGGAWEETAATIIHEATHQTAFNTGLHNRWAQPPQWVIEGLATMFEARGVWNARSFPDRTERLHRYRLERFRHYVRTRRPKGSLATFVGSDRPFKSDTDAAYAEAWALTFFLVEQEPRKFADYLTRVATRPDFSLYNSPERLRDFTQAFGANWPMLEARLLRFIEEL